MYHVLLWPQQYGLTTGFPESFLLQLSPHGFFVYPDDCSARAMLSVLVFTSRLFRVVVGFFFMTLLMYILENQRRSISSLA